jgi:hypothetical protein
MKRRPARPGRRQTTDWIPEVAIRRPELAHAVLAAKRGDPRIVNASACHLACLQQITQIGPMLIRFCEQHQGGRFKQRINVVEGDIAIS